MFHGEPIIAYSIRAAQRDFDRVVVSTDDDEIADVAREYKAEVLVRPPELAQDEVGTQEVVRHAIRSLTFIGEAHLCCIYATAPMIDPDDLLWASMIELLRPATFVVAVGTEPLRDIGMFYFGGIDAFMRQPLYGLRTQIYPIHEKRCIDINTEEDWMLAERMYADLHREAA